MTIEELKSYRSICARIKSIEDELREFEVTDGVQSASKFPYSKHTVTLSGLPPDEHIKRLQDEYRELKNTRDDITRYIFNCPDVQMRYILHLKYIKGKSNLSIAMKLGYTDETVIRRKIKKYFS